MQDMEEKKLEKKQLAGFSAVHAKKVLIFNGFVYLLQNRQCLGKIAGYAIPFGVGLTAAISYIIYKRLYPKNTPKQCLTQQSQKQNKQLIGSENQRNHLLETQIKINKQKQLIDFQLTNQNHAQISITQGRIITQQTQQPVNLAVSRVEIFFSEQSAENADENVIPVTNLQIQRYTRISQSQLADIQSIGSSTFKKLSEKYSCPITQRLMTDPYQLKQCKHCFERQAIRKHLEIKSFCPKCKEPANFAQGTDIPLLKQVIDQFIETVNKKNQQRINQDFRQT